MTTAADIEAQAAAWLVKRDGGALSEAEQAAFNAWMATDPRARAVYLRLEMGWKHADKMRRLRPLDGDVNEDLLARSPFTPVPFDEYSAREETRATPTALIVRRAREVAATKHTAEGHTPHGTHARISRLPSSDTRLESPDTSLAPSDASGDAIDVEITEVVSVPPSRARSRRWLAGLSVAATIAVLSVAALLWYAYDSTSWHKYSTDFGGLSRIVLDDGSVINLNTNSAIRVQLTPDLRHIVLERGEALFKVAHDKTRPFDVEAGGTTVRAVGTEFSVRLREPSEAVNGLKDIEVLVKEGRVAIDPPKNEQPRERAKALPASTSTLSAGEAVVISSQRVQVQKVAEAEVDKKLSWTEGRLWFERQTLKDVVAEFNRYNRRQMVIADPAIENLRIGGGFEATDPESFIAALERTLGVRAFPAPAGDGSNDEVIRLVGTRENTN